jgi:hypothetical protein
MLGGGIHFIDKYGHFVVGDQLVLVPVSFVKRLGKLEAGDEARRPARPAKQ